MSKSSKSVYLKLKELIDSDEHTELKCREYLHHVGNFLFRDDVLKEVVYVEPELRSSVGDSDYVISGYIDTLPTEDSCIRAYVWELKAPQCFVFREATKNRLCPSKDLVKAECQLLYYYDEFRGNDTLLNRFKVHRQHVRLGGIIIGSQKNLVRARGDYDERKKAKLYSDAIRIREEYFYNRAGIKLITWSHILDLISGKYSGIRKGHIDLDYTFKAPQLRASIAVFHTTDVILSPPEKKEPYAREKKKKP